MIETFQSFYAANPGAAMWMLLLALGNLAVLALMIIMVTGALFNWWRAERRIRAADPTEFDDLKSEPSVDAITPNQGNIMKKRIALVVLLACGFAAVSLLSGCQLLDRFDADIALVTEDGRTFAIHQTEQGIDIQGEFIEPHTGIVFVLGEGVGNITARDPKTGLQVTLKPKSP